MIQKSKLERTMIALMSVKESRNIEVESRDIARLKQKYVHTSLSEVKTGVKSSSHKQVLEASYVAMDEPGVAIRDRSIVSRHAMKQALSSTHQFLSHRLRLHCRRRR